MSKQLNMNNGKIGDVLQHKTAGTFAQIEGFCFGGYSVFVPAENYHGMLMYEKVENWNVLNPDEAYEALEITKF